MADQLHPDRVPDAESASADGEKFTGYLLNETHTRGKSKAKFFRNFGYDDSNWSDLRDAMLGQLPSVAATHSKSGDEFRILDIVHDLGGEEFAGAFMVTPVELAE